MDTTTLRRPRTAPFVLVLVGAVIGALAGWLGPIAARITVDQAARAGLREEMADSVLGPVVELAAIPTELAVPLLGFAGLIGGVFLAVSRAAEAPRVEVAGGHVEHRQRHVPEVRVERADVTAVFRDGNELVLLTGGALHARLDVRTLPPARVREALTHHGWPLCDADPFEADFTPWADGQVGFTEAENDLLRYRFSVRKDSAVCREADAGLTGAGLVARTRGRRLEARRVGDVARNRSGSGDLATSAGEGARGTDR